jgi:DNA integrity scanning protein DisA with diadenylate cyclase activity
LRFLPLRPPAPRGINGQPRSLAAGEGQAVEKVSRRIVQHAQQLAREVDARAVVVYADAVCEDNELRQVLHTVDFPTILVTRSRDPMTPRLEAQTWVTVPNVHMTRAGQVKAALLVCLARRILQRGDRVVCLTGVDGSHSIDSLLVLEIGTEPELFSLFDPLSFGGDVAAEVFERALSLAAQLSAEGREGRPVGALFVIGDSENVLAQSRNLVLNPFHGHPESERNILDPDLEETIKEFSALDGAFVVRGDGVVLTAGTQLVPLVQHSPLPGGLGTRHAAAAGITASTAAMAVCVSQSTGTLTVFKSGRLLTDIHRSANGGRLSV